MTSNPASTTAVTDRQQLVFDLFTTAVEGGVNDWAHVRRYHPWVKDDAGSTLVPEVEDVLGFSVEVFDDVDGPEAAELDGWTRVDAAVMERGLSRFLSRHSDAEPGSYWGRFIHDVRTGHEDDADHDARIASAVLQLGLFDDDM